MGTLLIQSGQVAGQYVSNPQQPGLLSIGFNFSKPIAAGNRIVACQGVFGPAQGQNSCQVGPTQIPVGPPTHPSGGGQDLGYNQATPFAASADIMWLQVTPTEAGSTQVWFRVPINGTNYGACWAGEYAEVDNTGYGFFFGVDGSDSWTATGTAVDMTRAGGKTCNVAPDLSVWMVTFGSGATVSGATYNQQGYVTDGANVGIAVQDYYFNTTGVFNPSWTLSASSNWIAANLTMKTLSFPLGQIAQPGKLMLGGIG